MPVSEARRILQVHGEILETFPFNCRNACPRVIECFGLVYSIIVESAKVPDKSEKQEGIIRDADAMLDALRHLGQLAERDCVDGPYYTEAGLFPKNGNLACKLDLLEDTYHEFHSQQE